MERTTHFAALVAELRTLCATQSTGTLFLATDDNNLAQFVLEKGEIVHIAFKGKRGEDALEALGQITSGRVRFDERAVFSTRNRRPLPQTADILATLESREATPHSSSQPLSPTPAPRGLSPESRAVLETSLTAVIGPIASLICAEHFARVTSLEEAIQALTGEIPDPVVARRFLATVRRHL